MDCLVHGVAKSQTQLGDFHFHFQDKYGEGEVRDLRTEDKAWNIRQAGGKAYELGRRTTVLRQH